MADLDSSVEKGTMVEVERSQPVVEQQVNLAGLYEAEIARFRVERAKVHRDPWRVIEGIAAEVALRTALMARRLEKEGKEKDSYILSSLERFYEPEKNIYTKNILSENLITSKIINENKIDKYKGDEFFSREGRLGSEGLSLDVLTRYLERTHFEKESRERQRRIGLLTQVLDGNADAQDLGRIVDNDDYVEFVAFLLEDGVLQKAMLQSYGTILPLSQSLERLDQAGLMRPLITLRQSGFSLDGYLGSETARFLSGDESGFQRLQKEIDSSSVQTIVQDPEVQEFTVFLSHAVGLRLSPNLIEGTSPQGGSFNTEDLYQKRQEIVYLMKLVYPESEGVNPKLGGIIPILQHPDLFNTFVDGDFLRFLDRVKSELGYRQQPSDFHSDDGTSKLTSAFKDQETNGLLLEDSTSKLLKELRQLGYRFRFDDLGELKQFIESTEPEKIAQVLSAYNSHVLRGKSFDSFDLIRLPDFRRLADISDIEGKLQEMAAADTASSLASTNGLRLFLTLGGNPELFNQANSLIHSEYFQNIRDAHRRIEAFRDVLSKGQLSDEVVRKIFTVAKKPTELDRIALRVMIAAEIAKINGATNQLNLLLQASNFEEANEMLTQNMVKAALPVLYSDLEGEELERKESQVFETAKRDPEFEDVLEIACRSVGIYHQEFSRDQEKLKILLGGIRGALELNLERNPQEYARKRMKASQDQFDRLFSDVDPEVKDEALGMWQNLTLKRRLRVSGSMITPEEATLSRLNTIKDIVRIDLVDHLSSLFLAKLETLREEAEKEGTSSAVIEQRRIFEQYLLTPDGQFRKDLPEIYKSVRKFVRTAQRVLKAADLPDAEKAKLSKGLGTYQAVAGSIRSLYRLHTISESRYKSRKDYVKEINSEISELTSGLKRLRMVDPAKKSTDVNLRALEEEVINDISKLQNVMKEENVEGQATFETETTVNFKHLAEAPDLTQSCQRITEVTGFNDAAYSRLVDGIDEMVDVYETRDGQRVRLARSFIELSKVVVAGEDKPRAVVLFDREYVHPQYHNFSSVFWREMVSHLLDRMDNAPHVSLIGSGRFPTDTDAKKLLEERGYRVKQVDGDYFINQSVIPLTKYYDSMYGKTDISHPHFVRIGGFYLIEKAAGLSEVQQEVVDQQRSRGILQRVFGRRT